MRGCSRRPASVPFCSPTPKDNLHTLFEPGREVVALRTVEDCLAQIERYLADDAARLSIAMAGQARTFAAHTFRRRIEEILAFVG